MPQIKEQGSKDAFNFEALDNVLAGPVQLEQKLLKAKQNMIDV